ncbi:hypothetical protein ABEB36_009269 [Hypothenemus hampei]|uniref:Uncharacterized protein n=1 Tax=Hypothenemus hampei TaxID=57062 RepID=A0ABD1EFV3_HYPHA
MQCESESETKQLKGIYLLKENKCRTIIENQDISYNDKTYGNAIVIAHENLQIKGNQNSNITIELKNYKLKDISLPHVQKIIPNRIQEYKENYHYHLPSIWTIFLYVSVIAVIMAKYWRYKKSRRKENRRQSEEDKPAKEKVNLPGDASF